MLLEPRASIRGSRRAGVRLPPQVVRGDRPVGRRVRYAEPVVRALERETFVAPVRLRYLVALLALGLGAWSIVPRALSYWRLHGAATEFANYAACMVGPTGPRLLRDRPTEFWRLVRRRLLAAPPDARPFAACAPSAEAFAEGSARSPVHQAKAAEFREYAAFKLEPTPTLSIAELTVTSARLEELAQAARPFAAADYTALVRPERNAKAAPHPMDLPRPSEGRGLPASDLGYSAVRASKAGYLVVAGKGANRDAFLSRDGGATWTAADLKESELAGMSGQCSAGEATSAFRLTQAGEQLRVESWLSGGLETSFPLASTESRLVGFACDRSAAVAITREDERRRPVFHLCPHLAPCRELGLPLEWRSQPSEGASFAVARVRSVTVLSVAFNGVVRVASSRDDGETWTPTVVAFDLREYPGTPQVKSTPIHLLSLDARVLLYAGSDRQGGAYPVLGSDDFGASWQAP